jgi:hypothetical protein
MVENDNAAVAVPDPRASDDVSMSTTMMQSQTPRSHITNNRGKPDDGNYLNVFLTAHYYTGIFERETDDDPRCA